MRPLRFLGDYFFGTEGRKLYEYERQVIREFGGCQSREEMEQDIRASR